MNNIMNKFVIKTIVFIIKNKIFLIILTKKIKQKIK